METRLFVIHRLTTRHSSDEVNPDKEKTPDDVLSWRNMEMSSSLPLHFPIEFTLTSPLHPRLLADLTLLPLCIPTYTMIILLYRNLQHNRTINVSDGHYGR